MSRRSLLEIQNGRDPHVFAVNVRKFRSDLGLSLRQLAEKSGVSKRTLVKIEQGSGCTPSIERKLAPALFTVEGWLWKPQQKYQHVLHPMQMGRWFFAEAEECQTYMSRYGLFEPGGPMRLDPDSIQDEAERLRLGRNNLASAFIRVTNAQLEHMATSSNMMELFRNLQSEDPDGLPFYYYCLRGAIQIRKREETFILNENDAFIFELRKPFSVGSLNPVGPNDLPPRLLTIKLYGQQR